MIICVKSTAMRRYLNLSKRWLISLQSLLCNHYLLLATLLIFGVFFFLGRGNYRLILDGLSLLVLVHLSVKQYRGACLRSLHALAVAIALTLIAFSYLLSGQIDYTRYVRNIYYFITLILAVHLLALHWLNRNPRLLNHLVIALLTVLMLAHLYGDLALPQGCIHRRGNQHCGLYWNPHLLSLFASLTLPLLIYWTITSTGWLNRLCFIVLMGAFYLLLVSGSRPGWLAALAGVMGSSIIFAVGYKRWLLLLAIGVFVSILYGSGIAGVDARLNQLFANFSNEERFAIWADSWSMMQQNSLWEWLFGHGIGGFRAHFSDYSRFRTEVEFVFPHNLLLEIMFDNGVAGVILVTTGYVFYFRTLINSGFTCHEPHIRYLIVALFAISLAQLLHIFFTLPFYSRDALLTTGLVVGTGLSVIEYGRNGYVRSDP